MDKNFIFQNIDNIAYDKIPPKINITNVLLFFGSLDGYIISNVSSGTNYYL